MSPSRRKRAPTIETEESLPCPECGKNTLRRSQGDCTLVDGTVIKNLDRFHCSNCGTDLFDRAAMAAR